MLDLVMTTRLGVQFQGRPLMSKEQVLDRFQLLKETSAKSVQSIADSNPTWLIQTAPEHLEMVRAAFASEYSDFMTSVPVHVVSRTEDGVISKDQLDGVSFSNRFLCLRLDSDDHYLPSPLTQALRRFDDRPVGTLVDFPRGFLLDMASGRVRRKTYSVQGPFYGIITTPDDPVAAKGHHGRARSGRRCVEQLSRSWIQTVHSDNFLTRFGGSGRKAELESMLGQMRRGRDSRPAVQILARPLDFVPLAPRKQKLLQRIVGAGD